MDSYFAEQEKLVQAELDKNHKQDFELLESLLGVVEACMDAITKVKIGQHPEHEVLLLLGQNLTLLSSSAHLVHRGYAREPMILLRSVAEQLILAIYFREFPETEEEYRTKNYRNFFRDHKIEKMMKRVQKEGKRFKKVGQDDKNYLHQRLFKELYEEASYFSHSNPGIINGVMFDEDTEKYTKGPKLHKGPFLAGLIRAHFSAAISTVVALGVCFNLELDDGEKKIIDAAAKRANELVQVFNDEDKGQEKTE